MTSTARTRECAGYRSQLASFVVETFCVAFTLLCVMHAWRLSILLVVGISGIYAEEVIFPTSTEDATTRYGEIGRKILERLREDSENVSR